MEGAGFTRSTLAVGWVRTDLVGSRAPTPLDSAATRSSNRTSLVGGPIDWLERLLHPPGAPGVESRLAPIQGARRLAAFQAIS